MQSDESPALFLPRSLVEVAAEANVSADALLAHSQALVDAFHSGSTTAFDKALRPALPAQCWHWPAYDAWCQHAGERPTRLRMVAAFAHAVLRRTAMRHRRGQLLANADRRPYWQLRVVGDSRDWPACVQHHHRIERWDSPFWLDHGLHQCRRVYCRCAIRAMTPAERAAATPPTP